MCKPRRSHRNIETKKEENQKGIVNRIYQFAMSDFPKGGDVETTRLWLDGKGFRGLFIDWEADAILGKSDKYIKSQFPSSPEGQYQAERLCGLLTTARQTPSPGMEPYFPVALFIPSASFPDTYTFCNSFIHSIL
jgi:hypothetical protein